MTANNKTRTEIKTRQQIKISEHQRKWFDLLKTVSVCFDEKPQRESGRLKLNKKNTELHQLNRHELFHDQNRDATQLQPSDL